MHPSGILTTMPKHPKSTIATLKGFKRERRKFAVLTCYDYANARLMSEAGVDAILVGDTYAEVCLGHDSTLPMTLDHLVTITAAVRRGAPGVFLIGDMPYLTYQITPEDAVRNAGRFMVDAACDCVKIEVDRRHADIVAAMSKASIPVMAHLGLRPQSIRQIGGYKLQGADAESAKTLIDDAKTLELAGACALLLEGVPNEVAKTITENTELPVIGIVAGPHTDGQVLVMHDILGYHSGHPPKHIKQYANLHDILVTAFRAFTEDVHTGEFPSDANFTNLPEKEWSRLQKMLDTRS
jgi:3-methyl-2-oxobutanoate hydroxymethyltransferase